MTDPFDELELVVELLLCEHVATDLKRHATDDPLFDGDRRMYGHSAHLNGSIASNVTPINITTAVSQC